MAHIHGTPEQPDASKATIEAQLAKALQSPTLLKRLVEHPAVKAIIADVQRDIIEKGVKANMEAVAHVAEMNERLDKIIETHALRLPTYVPKQPGRKWGN